MRPVHIGIVISSPSLDQCLKNIGAQKNIVLSLSYHGLEDAVPLGEKLAADGVETLVARSGTAYWLREKLQIPILSLPQSSLNVLRSVREAAKKGRRIFPPSFREKRFHMDIFAEPRICGPLRHEGFDSPARKNGGKPGLFELAHQNTIFKELNL